MNDMDMYNSLESELPSDPETLKFGGWLRFFQVINFVSAIISFLVVLLLGAELIWGFLAWGNDIEIYVFLAEIIPVFVFSVAVLKKVKIQERGTPQKLKFYIMFYFLSSMIITGLIIYLYTKGYVTEKPTSVFGDIVYFLIWSSYFKRSDRVNGYYGNNAK